MKIPLTLAIISALIVACDGQRFALPQVCVAELVRAGDRGHAGRRARWWWSGWTSTPVLRLRDRLLPLVRLSSLLQLAGRHAGRGGPAR